MHAPSRPRLAVTSTCLRKDRSHGQLGPKTKEQQPQLFGGKVIMAESLIFSTSSNLLLKSPLSYILHQKSFVSTPSLLRVLPTVSRKRILGPGCPRTQRHHLGENSGFGGGLWPTPPRRGSSGDKRLPSYCSCIVGEYNKKKNTLLISSNHFCFNKENLFFPPTFFLN